MPTITIQITVPDGTEVDVNEEPGTQRSDTALDSEHVERYFRYYLSDNGRKLYAAAARVEEHQGPGYTLSDIASNLNIDYASAQSYHRTSGRSARRWRDDLDTEAPIALVDMVYDWVPEENGMRTRYQLPAGVADIISTLP